MRQLSDRYTKVAKHSEISRNVFLCSGFLVLPMFVNYEGLRDSFGTSGMALIVGTFIVSGILWITNYLLCLRIIGEEIDSTKDKIK